MQYSFRERVSLSAGVSALSFGSQDLLSVGSADGCLRLYSLPNTRVVKAIWQLGDEVSSIKWSSPCDADGGEVWVASGIKLYKFLLNALQVIKPISAQNASTNLDLGEDDEDVLNDICLSSNNKYLAFTSDSGNVGIVDVMTNAISRMKSQHDSICSSVSFIPERPNEVVSGGYDSALLHFDFPQRRLLSRFDISTSPPTSGISLSPPFVLSLAVSSRGLIAASTADGRVWLGTGGDKSAPSSTNTPKARGSKKSRKWEGLSEPNSIWVPIAQGPVVAVYGAVLKGACVEVTDLDGPRLFANENTILTCSLLGSIKAYVLTYDSDGKMQAQFKWVSEVREVAKVNAVSANEKWLVVGGLTRDGKGAFEIWDYVSCPNTESES